VIEIYKVVFVLLP